MHPLLLVHVGLAPHLVEFLARDARTVRPADVAAQMRDFPGKGRSGGSTEIWSVLPLSLSPTERRPIR